MENAENDWPMPQRPQVWLDSTLPKSRKAPVHPETGKIWSERFQEICELATMIAYASSDEEEDAKEWRKKYDALKAGLEFRDEPHFVRHVISMGSMAASRAYGERSPSRASMPLPEIIGCHPEVWASMPEDLKSGYDVVDQDELNRKFNGDFTSLNPPV